VVEVYFQGFNRLTEITNAAAGGGAIPFNTQFFHDDYDDAPGFDDGFDGEGGAPEADAGDQDLLAATQGQTRRIKPEFVNYAKRAKRVDVRKLKENIWKGLNIVVEKNEREQMVCLPFACPLFPTRSDEVKQDLDDPPPPTDPSEARVFSSVISGLQRSYPRDKLEEISTSFCFICLLHLANEEGLKLESVPSQSSAKGVADDDAEVRLDENRVGKLWDLRVCSWVIRASRQTTCTDFVT
jgi:condensin complex subunit 2